MKKKKYYFDSIRPYRKHKSLHLLRRITEPILKRITKSPEYIYLEELPDEPIILVSNHATHYGTYVLNVHYYREKRIWALSTLFYVKTSSNHSMVYWFPNARGFKRILGRIITVILSIVMPYAYRSYEAIPVYKMSTRLRDTYNKSIETLNEGKDIIIFPESRAKSNEYRYTNQFQRGYSRFISEYYNKTGKKLKIYPVYCCSELNKVLIGKHYEYNPDINIKEQSILINKYLQDSIEEMGNSLPEHEITPYNREIKDPDYVSKKYKGIHF